MEILKTVFITYAIIAAICMLFIYLRGGKPLRSVLINLFLGLCGLIAVNLASHFTGIRIPVNWYSVGTAGVFGIPAVCGMLIMGLII